MINDISELQKKDNDINHKIINNKLDLKTVLVN